MVAIVDSSGFYIYGCSEAVFDELIADNHLKSYYACVPSEHLFGWLFMHPESLNVVKSLNITTCYVSNQKNQTRFSKFPADKCISALEQTLLNSSIEETPGLR